MTRPFFPYILFRTDGNKSIISIFLISCVVWLILLFLFVVFAEKATAIDDVNGPWPAKRRRNSIYKNMGLLCCVSRPNYL